MKKEIVKGLAMLTLIVAIAMATAVVSSAQSTRQVVAHIPFEFVLGDKAMPAAEYRVRPAAALGKAILIQTADSNNAALRLTNTLEPIKNQTRARLVFHKYGRQYFLAEVWTGGDDSGLQLLKSRQERAIEREFETIASKTKSAPATYAIVEVVATVR
ncbi:MAG: hypothetical protein M3539_05370 [Acidobacteriota bacterium]|nr:hypothetical protein [Acidobacteriota bacterium]